MRKSFQAIMETEQFSLCWNNFNTNLRNGFNSLLQEEYLVDVTLGAEGRFLKAHKAVLSVCSPYFKALFKENPCKHPIVILQGVNYDSLSSLLQFIYRGEVSVRQDEIPTFMKAAEMLKVKGLTENSSDDLSNTNGIIENNSHRNSPFSESRQQKLKTYPAKPQTKKVIKPVQQLRNVDSPKTIKSPSPTVKSPPPPAVTPPHPSKKPCLDEEEPTTETENVPFFNPKLEPLDTDDELNNDFDDGNLDMSEMLDTTLSEPSNSSNWQPDCKTTDASSPGTLQCVLGKRGNPRLIVDGHVFYKKSTYKGKSFWYCKLSRTPYKCQAVCWTLNGNIVKWPFNHSHVVMPEPFNPEEDIDVPIERLQEVLLQSAFTSEVKF